MSKIEETLKKRYGTEEDRLQARWIVVISMLESFSKLRERVKEYLMEEEG